MNACNLRRAGVLLILAAGCGDGPAGGSLQEGPSSAHCRSRQIGTMHGAAVATVARVGDSYHATQQSGATLAWELLQGNGQWLAPAMAPETPEVCVRSTVMRQDDAWRLVAACRSNEPVDANGDSPFTTRIWKRGAAHYTPPTPLLSAFYRGTIAADMVTSFDGRRALFAIGHVAAETPRAVMIDADGGRLGQRVDLPGDVFNLSVAATRHGAVLSVVEGSPITERTWRIVEIDESGAPVTRLPGLSLEAGIASPLIVIEGPSGLILIWHPTDRLPSLARVQRGTDQVTGPIELSELRELGGPEARVLGASAMGDGVALLVRDQALAVEVALVDAGGHVIDRLPLPAFSAAAQWVPTEPGLLALTTSPDAVGAARETSLIEIACDGV